MTQTVPSGIQRFFTIATTKKTLVALSALLLSVLASAQTFTTRADGAWKNPSTWVGGVAPTANIGAGVIINIKHDVSCDLTDDVTVAGTLNILNDTLRFPSSFSKKITVAATGNLVVINGGFLQNIAGREGELIVQGYAKFDNSLVLVGKNFQLLAGGRHLVRSSTVRVGEKYILDGSSSAPAKDTLQNTTLEVSVSGGGDFEVKDYATLLVANVKLTVRDGEIKTAGNATVALFSNGTYYYGFITIKTNKNLSNDGAWDARIDAYCVAGDVKGSRMSDIDFTRPEDCTLTPTQPTLGQMVINEVYTDPGNGKQEFIELYNVSTQPETMDNYTLVTYFENGTQHGFYVLDFPNLVVAPRSFFVGAAALPFNFQAQSNSTLANFNWNSLAAASNGSLKKWVRSTDNNESDGNKFYNLATAGTVNDLFTRLTGDVAYTFFLYKNGMLVNQIIAGSGGQQNLSGSVTTMPRLNVDMGGTSPDFSIDFANYTRLPLEAINQDAGTDNGFIRTNDGACGAWKKSSSGTSHTPMQSNNAITTFAAGDIAVQATVVRGTAATGSVVTYKVTAASENSLTAELRVYIDNGSLPGQYDPTDQHIDTKLAAVVGQSFSTTFKPFDANVLIVVKQAAGCVDNITLVKQMNPISVLPIHFTGFSAFANNAAAELSWNVIEGEGFSHFVVQRSLDGKTFSDLALVFSGGSSYTAYGYKDKTASAANSALLYYRIKGLDKNGAVNYSVVRTVRMGNDPKALELVAYPNPVKNTLSLTLPTAWQGKRVTADLVNANGTVVRRIEFASASQVESIETSMLPKGLYVVRASVGSTFVQQRIIKD